MAYIAEIIGEKVTSALQGWQHSAKVQMQKISWLLAFGCLIFIFSSMGIRFLLLGLAYWLNSLLASNYLGFFIISTFCFMTVVGMVLIVRRKMGKQDNSDS